MGDKEGGIFWGIGFWALFLGILFLMNAGVLSWETIKYPDQASAATTTTVSVTAKVTEDISCSVSDASIAFGTLSTSAIAAGTPTFATTSMSCGNVGGGCTLFVKDANAGLATDSPAYTIPSPAAGVPASATLAAGTEGYGIHASSTTEGSGATLTCCDRYSDTGLNDVGGLTTSNITIASTTATTSERSISVEHRAAISTITNAADYTDTITYECTAT